MPKILFIAHALNVALLTIFLIAVINFISYANAYGFFLAIVTSVIAYFCFKKNRWGYFAAAAWALACFQLAKQGYEFQSIKRQVMMLCFILVPVSIFLHETLGKSIVKNAQNDAKNSERDPKMHD